MDKLLIAARAFAKPSGVSPFLWSRTDNCQQSISVSEFAFHWASHYLALLVTEKH
jgi:hypothetical protein